MRKRNVCLKGINRERTGHGGRQRERRNERDVGFVYIYMNTRMLQKRGNKVNIYEEEEEFKRVL